MNLHVVLDHYDQLSDQFKKQIVLEQKLWASRDSFLLNFAVN